MTSSDDRTRSSIPSNGADYSAGCCTTSLRVFVQCFLLLSAALVTASVATATDSPTAEAFLGYNWVRFNPDTPNLPGFNGLPSFALHGGNAQLAYNLRL